MSTSHSGPLFSMANEIIDEISFYLPPAAQTQFMFTSHRMHNIGARNLYKTLAPSRAQTRRLCLTLVCKNLISGQPYADYVRSFTYEPTSVYDIDSLLPIIVSALTMMRRLRTLTLDVSLGYPDDIITRFNSSHIFRNHVKTPFDRPIYYPQYPNWSRLVLPALENLSFIGDIRIAAMAQHRLLRSITITAELSSHQFRIFMKIMTASSQPNLTLKHLKIAILGTSSLEHLEHLNILSNIFPVLDSLCYGSPNLNALHVSNYLSIRQGMFPDARSISFNSVVQENPIFRTSDDESLELQKQHLKAIGASRPDLSFLRFGNVLWIRQLPLGLAWKEERLSLKNPELHSHCTDQSPCTRYRIIFHDTLPTAELFDEPPTTLNFFL